MSSWGIPLNSGFPETLDFLESGGTIVLGNANRIGQIKGECPNGKRNHGLLGWRLL